MADALQLRTLVVSTDGDAHCRYRGEAYVLNRDAGQDLRARRIAVLAGDERVERVEGTTEGSGPYTFPGPNTGCGTGSPRSFWLVFNDEDCTITVRVRIKLVPEEGVELTWDKKRAWKETIEESWSNWVFFDRLSGPAPCDHYTILVEVVWLSEAEEGEDYGVTVRAGDARARMRTWYLGDPNIVAAHEFGHMLGNVDEYYDEDCPNRPVRDGIMNDEEEWPYPFRRHYTAIRQWVEYYLCSEFEVEYKWYIHGGGL